MIFILNKESIYYQRSFKDFHLFEYSIKDSLKPIKHTVNMCSIEFQSTYISNIIFANCTYCNLFYILNS